MKDTIYRADAIEAVRNVSRDLIQDKCMPLGCATDFTDALSTLPSAEAVCRDDALYERWVESEQAADYYRNKTKASAETLQNPSEPNNGLQGSDLISRHEALKPFCITPDGARIPEVDCDNFPVEFSVEFIKKHLLSLPSAEAVQGWIPCSERLPKINQRVLLATNEGRVFVGYKEKPDLVWRVTEADGREHWVYDPEHYTDDIDILLKEDDCFFSEDNQYSDGFMSVTSINYDDRFEGVTAWMPLPKPYKGGEDE